ERQSGVPGLFPRPPRRADAGGRRGRGGAAGVRRALPAPAAADRRLVVRRQLPADRARLHPVRAAGLSLPPGAADGARGRALAGAPIARHALVAMRALLRRRRVVIAAAAVLVVAVALGGACWVYASRRESSNDALIDGRIV